MFLPHRQQAEAGRASSAQICTTGSVYPERADPIIQSLLLTVDKLDGLPDICQEPHRIASPKPRGK